jgi:hypothetical protein
MFRIHVDYTGLGECTNLEHTRFTNKVHETICLHMDFSREFFSDNASDASAYLVAVGFPHSTLRKYRFRQEFGGNFPFSRGTWLSSALKEHNT